MNLKHPPSVFKNMVCRFTRFELFLWLTSVIVITVSFLITRENLLTLLASLVGVTALIFLARGAVIGQVLVLIFSLLYGLVSWQLHYWGEMLTYLCMTAPMAMAAMLSWIRHPYKDSGEVRVQKLSGKQIAATIFLTIAATALFGSLLALLKTPQLPIAIVSVTTSFAAATLTFLRSPYYALGYAANDIVLILLWGVSAAEDLSYLPMTLCFVMFLANDLYGFYSWRLMQKRQSASSSEADG